MMALDTVFVLQRQIPQSSLLLVAVVTTPYFKISWIRSCYPVGGKVW